MEEDEDVNSKITSLTQKIEAIELGKKGNNPKPCAIFVNVTLILLRIV